jgi:hypothetical protein
LREAADARLQTVCEFDPRQRPSLVIEEDGFAYKEAAMSFDTMLVTAAVLSVFVAFAAVLFWGDFQTIPARQKTCAIPQRRRSS